MTWGTALMRSLNWSTVREMPFFWQRARACQQRVTEEEWRCGTYLLARLHLTIGGLVVLANIDQGGTAEMGDANAALVAELG